MKCEHRAGHTGIHGNPESGNHHQARHTEKLSGDTYQPVYLPWPAKREGRGGEGQTATQMHNYKLKIARPPERICVI